MFTRHMYVSSKCDHDAYYNQFVTPEVIELVAREIGVQAIMESNELSFNDIPLARWDSLHVQVSARVPSSLWKKTNGIGAMALLDTVCIAKQAARSLRTAKRDQEGIPFVQ